MQKPTLHAVVLPPCHRIAQDSPDTADTPCRVQDATLASGLGGNGDHRRMMFLRKKYFLKKRRVSRCRRIIEYTNGRNPKMLWGNGYRESGELKMVQSSAEAKICSYL